MARKNNNYKRSGGRDASNQKWEPSDKGKTSSKRRRSKNDRNDQIMSTYTAENDMSWYSRYPNLLAATARIPFPYRPGMQLPMYVSENPSGTVSKSKPIPGIMALDWAPAPGLTSVSTDPAAVAAKEIYARVRQVYSGSIDADAPDFIVYLMSLDSVFSYIGALKRIYRLLNAYTPENYILPDRVLVALGLNTASITNLRAQKADLWQGINELVLQSRKFTCPAVFDIMNRHYWMNDNVYSDANMINAQFYVFRQIFFYQYAAVDMPDGNPGPGCKYVPSPINNTATVASLINFGYNLIQQLVAWDDAYIINGYLRRAFESERQFSVDEMPADQPFNPVYEPEVLSQIENARPITFGTHVASEINNGKSTFGTISQSVDTNAVIFMNQFTVDTSGTILADTMNLLYTNAWNLKPHLSVRSQSPTIEEVVISSRLHDAVEVSGAPSGGIYRFAAICATEVLFRLAIFTPTTSFIYAVPYVLNQRSDNVIGVANQMITDFLQMQDASVFDWRPMQPVITMTGTAESPTVGTVTLLGDYHNITDLEKRELQQIHRVCSMSEWNAFSIIPQI